MTMDYPIGTVLQYKSTVGYDTWTVIAKMGMILTLELTSIHSSTEIRPIGHKVPISPAQIDSHIKGKFAEVVFLSTIADIET